MIHCKYVVWAAAILLVGCNQHSEADQALSQQEDKGRPVLAAAGVDLIPSLQRLGEPWSAEPLSDETRYDSGVELTRRRVMLPAGLVVVDREAHGGITYVRIQAGMGSRCGAYGSLGPAYVALTNSLKLPDLQPADLSQLRKGWSSGSEIAEVVKPGVTIRASGGCLPTLSLKAA